MSNKQSGEIQKASTIRKIRIVQREGNRVNSFLQ